MYFWKILANEVVVVIINHVSVGVKDVQIAVNFYDAVFQTLSIKRSHYIEGVAASYGDSFEFWVGCLCENKPVSCNAAHIAFNAPDNSSVNEFHRVALQNGATCAGQPGLRPEYGESYYAAYVYDLDGNKIEAVSSKT